MANRFFSPSPLWQTTGLTLIRLTVGYFMIYHGAEVFSAEKMNGYLQWDLFKNSSSGKTMLYAGKMAEFAGGILLFIGLFTRVAAIILAGTMGYISFFVGHGKIWYDDQHPFLFVLLALVFFFTGGGRWSADHLLFKRSNN
jgi:uncharacterized membrane protein YphA (DoxX/SURF4 family)